MENLHIRKLTTAIFLAISGFMMSVPSLGAGGFVLGPGDVVHVTVYQHPDLGVVTGIGQDGTISFPLLGDVKLGGLMPDQAEKKLATLLEGAGFVKSAQVSLIIDQYRSQQVAVLGEVDKPGRYPIESNDTVIDLLAVAGGIKPGGADKIKVIKHHGDEAQQMEVDLVRALDHGDTSQDIHLSNGDVIYVPRMDVFYIYGQVQHPGVFRLESDMTVMQALAVGGGLTRQGTEKGIKINRHDQGGSHTIEAGMTDKLMADDVIYVKESLF